MTMKTPLLILAGCLLCLPIAAALSQTESAPPKHLMREDSAAVNALVMYPDTIRLHIFQASEYPAAIVSIATLQKNTSSDFADLVSGFPKDQQEDFWNLSRYPDLVARLAEGDTKSSDETEQILAGFPAEIHDAGLRAEQDHHDILVKMSELSQKTDDQFAQIISDYPEETQTALRDIIQYPEIISLLNDHLSLTVRVGDRFRRNPERVIHRADSLHDAIAAQNAEDAAAWKQTIEDNPDQAADLQSAGADYAADNGYSQDDVNAIPAADEINNYTCAPYPYWFGYPSWYPYDYWYPYPYWFDCGYYRAPGGRIVVIGPPSYYFTNWYFYRPEHWHHFPHLGDAYVYHYYGPRRVTGPNTIIVHTWVRNNRDYLPKDFLTNPVRRTDAIRQVAQFNIDIQMHAGAGKTVTPAMRSQFFQQNRTKYPTLAFETNKKLDKDDRLYRIPDVIQPPVKQPPVRMLSTINRPVRTAAPVSPPAKLDLQQEKPDKISLPADRQDRMPSQPDQQRNTQPPTGQAYRLSTPARSTAAPARQQAPAPQVNFNKINKAQEYHRNVWEQTQPSVRQQPQQPAPQRFQPPPRQEAPVRQEPPKPAPPKKF